MSDSLPDTIETERLLHGEVTYRLPPRELGKLRFIGWAICLGATFPLGFAVYRLLSLALGPRGVIEVAVSVLFALAALAGGLFVARFGWLVLFGRTELSVQDGQVVSIERAGLARRRVAVPLARLKRLVVLNSEADVASDRPNPLAGLCALRAERTDGGAKLLAMGYPKELLAPLANHLARAAGQSAQRQIDAVDDETTNIEVAEEELTADPVRGFLADVREQPAQSRVVVEQLPDGLTLSVPPAGLMKGSKGLFAFALIWDVFMTAFTGFMVFAWTRAKHEGMWLMIGLLGVFWAVGFSIMAAALNMGLRRAALAVAEGALLVVQTGPWSRKQREWAPGEVAAVRCGPSGLSVNDRPVMELQVISQDGSKFGVLAGRDDFELRWMATLLRDALGVPAFAEAVESSKTAAPPTGEVPGDTDAEPGTPRTADGDTAQP